MKKQILFIVSTLIIFLVESPNISFSAPPTASIIIPSQNISIAPETPVAFSGIGVATSNGTGVFGAKVDYTIGVNPMDVIFDSITSSLWVINTVAGSKSISKINISTGAVMINYVACSAGGSPAGITFDSITNSVWVVCNPQGGGIGYVGKINPSTGSRVNYTVGSGPFGATFDSVTNSVWVANELSNTVSKVNINTGARVDYAVGVQPNHIAFDPVTNSMWVTNAVSHTVSKVNINTGARVDYAGFVGPSVFGPYMGPYGAVFDSVTNSVWVANNSAKMISKFNIFNGTRTDYAVFTGGPSIVFDSVTGTVWVPGSKVDVLTGTRTDFALTSSFIYFGSVMDPITRSIWITNDSVNSISKVSIGTVSTTISTYEWRDGSCTAGVLLSSISSFLTSSLAVGSHPIFFRAQDSLGGWSSCDSRTITVASPPTVNIWFSLLKKFQNSLIVFAGVKNITSVESAFAEVR